MPKEEFIKSLNPEVNPQEPIKRGRGRPPGSVNKSKEQEIIPEAIVTPAHIGAVKTIFYVIAKISRFDGWNLADDEAIKIASPFATLSAYYFPKINYITWAWIDLGTQLSTILASRAILIKTINDERAKQKKDKSGQPGQEKPETFTSSARTFSEVN